MMRLTEAQMRGLRAGSSERWLGCRETGVPGDTMDALERRGLAQVSTAGDRRVAGPARRFVYRLTDAGVRERRRITPLAKVPAETLLKWYVAGDVSHEDYIAEMDRRAGARIVVYHWPEGRLSEVWRRPAEPRVVLA